MGFHFSDPETSKFEVFWGINYEQLHKRFSPENTGSNGSLWISDVFFAYSLVTRAILKARPLLTNVEIHTGVLENDKKTKEVLDEILKVVE